MLLKITDCNLFRLCRKDQEIEQLRQQLYNSGGHSFAPSSPSTVRS